MATVGISYHRRAVAVVRTSDDARDLLRDFAEQHGIAVSWLLEALARRLPVGGDLNPFFEAVVSEARAIGNDSRRKDQP